MKLIDKDALIAEIERLDELNIFLISTDKYNEDYKCGYEHALEKVRDFIDTLEVKEVDFNKELSYEDYKGFFEKYPNLSDDWGFEEAWTFAKHFFELGLKAHKG